MEKMKNTTGNKTDVVKEERCRGIEKGGGVVT